VAKTIKILVNDDEFEALLAILDRDYDIRGAMKIASARPNEDKHEIELEINGMLTYDLWIRFCKKLDLHIAYPG